VTRHELSWDEIIGRRKEKAEWSPSDRSWDIVKDERILLNHARFVVWVGSWWVGWGNRGIGGWKYGWKINHRTQFLEPAYRACFRDENNRREETKWIETCDFM
jgi:hypothetical protein